MTACEKCNDTGWYRYDHNHAMPCPGCCRHDQGVWLLTYHHGNSAGKWCCKAGCGTTWAGVADYARDRRLMAAVQAYSEGGVA